MDTRQLILIRQFYSEARLTPAAETPFLRIKRTLHLDLCVELALNVIVRDFGTPEEHKKQGGRFDLNRNDLWALADAVVKRKASKTLPERSALKTLHELRNLAQHRGSAPSSDEVRGTVEPVRALMDFICRDLYGLDFERLREWDVLEHEALRHWLDDCYEALDRGQPFFAAAGCKLAYDRIIESVRKAAAGPDGAFHYGRHIQVTTRELADAVNAIAGAMREGMLAMEAELVAVSLGLPIADHFRFQRESRGVVVTPMASGHWTMMRRGPWPSDDEEARVRAAFMVEYLGRACVLLESAYPGVFGSLRLPKRLRESEHWTHAFGAPEGDEAEPGEGA